MNINIDAVFVNSQVAAARVLVRRRLKRTNPKVPGTDTPEVMETHTMARDALNPRRFTANFPLPASGTNYKLLLRIEGRNGMNVVLDLVDTAPR